MSPAPYYTMIRSKHHKFDLRLVIQAKEHGICHAARSFGCSRNTVRKWLRRFEHHGRRGNDQGKERWLRKCLKVPVPKRAPNAEKVGITESVRQHRTPQ